MKKILSISIIVIVLFSIYACNAKSTALQSTETVTDDQLAKNVLFEFLNDLYSGKYDQATGLYGGSYETMQSWNPDLDPSAHAALMEKACIQNGTQCLQMKSAVLDQKISDTDFVFKVRFLREDGTDLVIGPCCGANATDDPPRSDFFLTVVKTDEGKFVVMNMPPYQP